MDWKDEPLAPRASREERLRYRREGCAHCRQDAPLRRRPNPLFLVVVLAAAVVYLLVVRTARSQNSQKIEIQQGRYLSWTALEDGERRGLSFVLHNSSAEGWAVGLVIASAGAKAYTNIVNTHIPSGSVEAAFLPLPSVEQKYNFTVEPL